MPDELYQQARQAGLDISQFAQRAVAGELTRLAKIAALDTYLSELEASLGPTSDTEGADAPAWADRVLGDGRTRRSR